MNAGLYTTTPQSQVTAARQRLQRAINPDMGNLVSEIYTHNQIALDKTIAAVRKARSGSYAYAAERLASIAKRCVAAVDEVKSVLPTEAA